MIVINAENLILGRLATFVAKQALLGQEVRVINAEKAIVSGKKKSVLAEKKNARDRGIPTKGPSIPRMADRYVRRTIRGMLPHRQAKGAEAYKGILCYVGVPEEFKDAEVTTLDYAKVEKLPTLNYIPVSEIVRHI
jgi:large subunit ribosomal protein L13